jgi:hypothetical protein
MSIRTSYIPTNDHCKQYWIEGSPEEVIREVGSKLEQDRATH